MISGLLAVSERSVQSWTKDVRKAEKEAQQDKAFDLWLDCHDVRAIGEAIDMAKSTVDDIVSEKRKSAEFGQAPESRQHFDVWQFATEIGVDQTTVSDWLGKMNDGAFSLAPESRQHFDVWQFQTADKDSGQQSYFGAVPPQVLENLLWFYTEPGQTVVAHTGSRRGDRA